MERTVCHVVYVIRCAVFCLPNHVGYGLRLAGASWSNQAKYQRTFNTYLGRHQNYVLFEYLLYNCACACRYKASWVQSKKIIVIIIFDGERAKTWWNYNNNNDTYRTPAVCARLSASFSRCPVPVRFVFVPRIYWGVVGTYRQAEPSIDADGDNDDGIHFSYLLKNPHNSLSSTVFFVVTVIAHFLFCTLLRSFFTFPL